MGYRVVLANAFSVNMVPLPIGQYTRLVFWRVDLETAKTLIERATKELNAEIMSIVGHEATTKLLSEILGIPVTVNRVNYTLGDGDILIVFTIPVRLPEGKVLSAEEIQQYAKTLNIFVVAHLTTFDSIVYQLYYAK